ncbi:hypothetical protein DFH06DRAFT_1332496 [Mycena polygramma]|nr:hypothetical protein DFH06DRAFT_1332496 [Mycena polygramma]
MAAPNPPTAVFHPGALFLQTESTTDASRLLGSFDYSRDFCMARMGRVDDADVLAYMSKETEQPLHALLIGQILLVENLAAGHASRTRTTLAALPSLSAKGKIYHENDIHELFHVMASATDQHTTVVTPWIIEHSNHGWCTYVQMFAETKVVNGPVSLGDIVVLDVSLHRRDTCKDTHTGMEFFIVAHEVERVHAHYLEQTGVIVRDISMEVVARQIQSLEINRDTFGNGGRCM